MPGPAAAVVHADSPPSASYAEWSVAPALRGSVACVWAAQLGAQGERHVQRVIPDGCIDLVFSDGELTIAGPDTESFELQVVPNRSFAGLRFRAGCAPAVLRVAASELLDQHIDARELLGTRAGELSERLASARSPRTATALFEQIVANWVRRATPTDALVAR